MRLVDDVVRLGLAMKLAGEHVHRAARQDQRLAVPLVIFTRRRVDRAVACEQHHGVGVGGDQLLDSRHFSSGNRVRPTSSIPRS
jgi:hypothetical protein